MSDIKEILKQHDEQIKALEQQIEVLAGTVNNQTNAIKGLLDCIKVLGGNPGTNQN